MAKTKETTQKSNSAWDRRVDIHDAAVNSSYLFYGRSGTGKTTLVSTFPKPILILQAKEKGTTSMTHLPRGAGHVIQLESWEDIEDIYWRLKRGGHGYKTVVWETLGGIQELARQEVAGDGKVSKQGWGEISSLIKTWAENYANLQDMYVVFTAHDRVMGRRGGEDEEDLEEGEIDPEVGAATIPSVSKFINGLVQVIGNTFIRKREVQKDGKLVPKTEFRLRVGPHPYYITKIRTPKGYKVPASIQDPTFEKLVAIQKGEAIK